MKRSWSHLVHAPSLLPICLFAGSLVSLFLMWGVMWMRLESLTSSQAFVPLHYNVLTGVDRFGSSHYLFLPFWLAGIAWVLNTIFAIIAYRKRDRRLALLMGWFTFFITLLSAAAFFFGLILVLSLTSS